MHMCMYIGIGLFGNPYFVRGCENVCGFRLTYMHIYMYVYMWKRACLFVFGNSYLLGFVFWHSYLLGVRFLKPRAGVKRIITHISVCMYMYVYRGSFFWNSTLLYVCVICTFVCICVCICVHLFACEHLYRNLFVDTFHGGHVHMQICGTMHYTYISICTPVRVYVFVLMWI